MWLILSKILPTLVLPLGLACVLLSITLLLKDPRRLKQLSFGALLILFIGGNEYVSTALVRSLEWRYLPPQQPPHAAVIVLLTGDTAAANPPRPLPLTGERSFYAAHLYHQGAAPRILISGGNVQFNSSEPTPSAAVTVAQILQMLDVPPQDILLESDSQNTAENARFTKAILAPMGITRILLVTSAQHMPRAVGLFRTQGFEVIPMPTGYQVSARDWDELLHPPTFAAFLLDLFPTAENLAETTGALREYLGLWVYTLRGEITP
ncbi:MAG: YdcF family protein [Anaerolineales bacterium]